MVHPSPLSVSDSAAIHASAEKAVKTQLQARREAFALDICRFTAWICAALALLMFGVGFLAQSYPQVWIYALLILLLAIGAALYPVFQRRHWGISGFSLVLGLILVLVSFCPLLIPNLLPVIGISDAVAVMVAILVLGERSSRWLVVGYILAYLVDVVLVGILGWSPFPPLAHDVEVWITAIVSLIAMLTIVLSVRLIVLSLEQQFRRAQRLNFELEAQMQAVNATQGTLSEERTMLRTLIDAVPDYIFVKDTQRRYLLSNLAHTRAAGVSSPNAMIGKTATDYFPSEYVLQHDADDEAVLRGESFLAQERQTTDQDGRLIWVLTTKVPLRDAQGTISGLVGISRNITSRKQAEEALQHERNLLRALFDAVPANVFIKDTQDRFVDANAETIHKLGMSTRADLVGKTDFDFFDSGLAAKYLADDQTVLQLGQPLLNLEEPSVDQRTGQKLWYLTTKAPICNEYGEVMGLVGVALDITGRKQAEQQSLELRNERQRAQVLHQFIGDATHDLMTPIAIINTSVELARKASTPDRLLGHLGKIERMSETLQDRLQDMLTMSQLDMMTAEDLEFRTVDLAQLLRRLIETFCPQAEAKAQQLRGEVEDQAGTLQADDLYLSMALAKVVENAIHYTEQGGTIQLFIRRHATQVEIAIQDSGIGIADSELAHIFERFYRAKSHRPLDFGAGLGLSIAQRILDLHHGRIEVSSGVGKGSTFKLFLPGDNP